MSTEPLLFLVGPTGSGKSRLALSVAPALGADVLSMDSMSVYEGMDIGTAKPGSDERRSVTHHLLDLVGADQAFNVADYLEGAERVLRDLAESGRRGLFVGGTALYMKALISGLFEGPAADAGVRGELAERAEREGSETLHAELTSVDPEAARRIHPNDLKRIVRALEVYRVTGKPISEFQEQWASAENARRHVIVGLDWDRQELYARIDRRVIEMFERGLVDEVRGLLARHGQLGPTASKAVGYSEVVEHLGGAITQAETVELVQRHSRQLAKRQLTWLRRFGEIRWVRMSPGCDQAEIAGEVVSIFEKALSETSRG